MNRLSRLSVLVLLLIAAVTRSQGALNFADFDNVVIPANLDGVYVNTATGATTIVPPSDFNTAPWLNLFFGGTAIGSSSYIAPVITARATGNGDGLVLKLLTLQEIGPALEYATGINGSENHTGSGLGQFQPGISGYLGFSFKTLANGPVLYGWMRITVSDTGAGILHDMGYEDTPGASILAGAVPEPAVPALLLLSTVTVIFSRRRKSRE